MFEINPARSKKRLIIGGAIGLLVLLLAGVGFALWPAAPPHQGRIMINLSNMAVMSMRKNGKNGNMMLIVDECLRQVAKLNPQYKWSAQLRVALDALPT